MLCMYDGIPAGGGLNYLLVYAKPGVHGSVVRAEIAGQFPTRGMVPLSSNLSDRTPKLPYLGSENSSTRADITGR
jgi:hypothetical protein